jgi:predicted dehydrogenase
MQEKKVRFAVLGYGHIGRKLADIIAAGSEYGLAALCDVREQATREQGTNVSFFRSYDELLNSDCEFDVLYIATPNGLHLEHALAGIRSGHHVVIEKPMALTKDGCGQIIAEGKLYNRWVFCVMQNRFSAVSQWLKQVFSNGIAGKVFMVQVNCYWNRDERYYTKDNWHGTKQLDGGTLFTQFAHFVDTVYWLFGDIANVHARLRNFNHEDLADFEDSGVVSFELQDGGIGSFNFSTAVWNKNLESSITIIAEKGTIRVAGQYMDRVEYCNIKDYALPAGVNETKQSENHRYVLQNVVDVLNGRAEIATSAEEGMKVVEIIERMYASANETEQVTDQELYFNKRING